MADDVPDISDVASRRQFLLASGAAGTTLMAGCLGGGNNTGDTNSDNTKTGNNGDNTESGSTESANGGNSNSQLSGTIDIAGSSTVFPLATAMAERFQKQHSQVKINLQSTGTGGGFANHFCPGRTDFNNASRPIEKEEMSTCKENNVNPVELNVATDALTVVVNNNADWVDCLTVKQLKQLWSAKNKPKTWKDINSDWPDENLELYGPTDASGTYDYFIEAILGEEGPDHRQDYSATEKDRQIIRGVKGSEYALGYLGFAYYSENKDTVKALGIDNGNGCIKPSLKTAKSGTYKPLSRPLFTYPAKKALAKEHIAEFAKFWIENSTSEKIVAQEVGYVPLDKSQQQKQMKKLQTAIDEANQS